MFIAFGAFFVGWAQQYDMGTAARMGPAFFPTMLGGIMFVLGVIVLIEGLAVEHADGKIEPFLQGADTGLGAVIAFGCCCVQRLVVALFVLTECRRSQS